MSTLVHLIYIHGFQGNDTTFQSFPKHLQEHLEARIPNHLSIRIQSSIYPTYKSVKPISHATKNFLEWLSTQPPGPVILLGHSMGGLLAADAATDQSNNPDRQSGGKPKRIIGVMAFDTPYLGMHPHVVVSGIASLLPKDDGPEKKAKSERSMNQHPQVKVVDTAVTDDWEAFKKQVDVHLKNAPFPDSKRRSFTHSPNRSQESALSATSSSLAPSSHSEPPSRMERAFAYVGAKDDDPLVRWLRKHADDPFSAGKRWIVERFQFGACMFDPPGLKARYSRLVQWGSAGGVWVNYWTTTVPNRRHHDCDDPAHKAISNEGVHEHRNNDESMAANEMTDNAPNSPKRSGSKSPEAKDIHKDSDDQSKVKKRFWKQQDQRPKERDTTGTKSKKERHFVVLPNGLGEVLGGMEKWENIPIAGVRDEVTAHTGLFIPQHNLNYDSFVEKVGLRILAWCEPLHSGSMNMEKER